MSFRDDLLKVLGLKDKEDVIPTKPPVKGKVGLSINEIPTSGKGSTTCYNALTFNEDGQPMATNARIIDGLYEKSTNRRVRLLLDYDAIPCSEPIPSDNGFYIINNIKKHITKKISTAFWNETGITLYDLPEHYSMGIGLNYATRKVPSKPYYFKNMASSSDELSSPEIYWSEYQRNTLFTDYTASKENEPLSITDMKSISTEKKDNNFFSTIAITKSSDENIKKDVQNEIERFLYSICEHDDDIYMNASLSTILHMPSSTKIQSASGGIFRDGETGVDRFFVGRAEQYNYNVQIGNNKLNGRIYETESPKPDPCPSPINEDKNFFDNRCGEHAPKVSFCQYLSYQSSWGEFGNIRIIKDLSPNYVRYYIHRDESDYNWNYTENNILKYSEIDRSGDISILVSTNFGGDVGLYPGSRYLVMPSTNKEREYCAKRLVDNFGYYEGLNPRQKCLSFMYKHDSPFSLYSASLLSERRNGIATRYGRGLDIWYRISSQDSLEDYTVCKKKFPEMADPGEIYNKEIDPIQNMSASEQFSKESTPIGGEGKFVTFEFDTYVDKNVIDLKFNMSTAMFEGSHHVDNKFVPPQLQKMWSMNLYDDSNNTYSISFSGGEFSLSINRKGSQKIIVYFISSSDFNLRERK